jgi:hypothetical protein
MSLYSLSSKSCDKNFKKETHLIGKVVFGRYRVDDKLGNGSFGIIYNGEDLYSNDVVAMKLESQKCHSQLAHESRVYKALSDGSK